MDEKGSEQRGEVAVVLGGTPSSELSSEMATVSGAGGWAPLTDNEVLSVMFWGQFPRTTSSINVR